MIPPYIRPHLTTQQCTILDAVSDSPRRGVPVRCELDWTTGQVHIQPLAPPSSTPTEYHLSPSGEITRSQKETIP